MFSGEDLTGQVRKLERDKKGEASIPAKKERMARTMRNPWSRSLSKAMDGERERGKEEGKEDKVVPLI
jgi:hypothetical protein